MQQEIIDFTNNLIAQNRQVLKPYIQNKAGQKYKKRDIFANLKENIVDFFTGKQEINIVTMPGLRGVGKTTILAQLLFEFDPNPDKRVIYLSVDQLVESVGGDLNQFLSALEQLFGGPLFEQEEDIILLLDEIQYGENWDSFLKIIADRYHNCFVVATGSSCLSLHDNPDLARRSFTEKLLPLSFSEYDKIQTNNRQDHYQEGLSDDGSKSLRTALFNSENATECLERLNSVETQISDFWFGRDKWEIKKYLKLGTFPFCIDSSSYQQNIQLIQDLLGRIIDKDLPTVEDFSLPTLKKAHKVMLLLAASDAVSYNNLAQTIEGTSKSTIIKIITALTKSELLIESKPLGSTYKKVRKSSRYHFMSPALRLALLAITEGASVFENNKGKLLEDLVAMYLYRMLDKKAVSEPLMHDPKQGGADFVLNSGVDRQIVLEVGFNKTSKEQIETTKDRVNNFNYGLLITDVNELEKREETVVVPLKYFLLA